MTEMNEISKSIIMAMTFEFAIIVIKLTTRLQRVGDLEDSEMDDIQNSVCKLQSFIAKVLDVDQSNIDKGAAMAFSNNDIEKPNIGNFDGKWN
jgi:(p)ppGpp synthase/HD superfamily hydrolase